ncbi:MAG: hypothetical protein LRZ99_03155 [Desulfotomaculum sp.]|nr:hypothetical protein [Desulfotomaculum sp.]MCL0081186.1 hypothetical protein [Peptococcaceae bacterium]
MENLKKQSLAAISKLPDSANIDDMMYRLYVIDKIRKGEDAVKRGEVIPIEDLKREMSKKEVIFKFNKIRQVIKEEVNIKEFVAEGRKY